jgi:hypothetical protein
VNWSGRRKRDREPPSYSRQAQASGSAWAQSRDANSGRWRKSFCARGFIRGGRNPCALEPRRPPPFPVLRLSREAAGPGSESLASALGAMTASVSKARVRYRNRESREEGPVSRRNEFWSAFRQAGIRSILKNLVRKSPECTYALLNRKAMPPALRQATKSRSSLRPFFCQRNNFAFRGAALSPHLL